MGIQEMEPIFGQLKAEVSAPHTTPLRPFLLHVHCLPTHPPALGFHVTDFHSNTWQSLKTQQDLEDMRDVTGIGGSCSDFLDYVLASIKSDDVKLVLEGDSVDDARAKLIAQKAKGMPRITILLRKLVDAAASEAMANLSLELYKSFKNVQNALISEQERCCHLSKAISVEQVVTLALVMLTFQIVHVVIVVSIFFYKPFTLFIWREKNETIQKQLDGFLYPKRQKSNKVTDKLKSDPASSMDSQNSPDSKAAQQPSTKVSNRVVPTHRRAKVRGGLLQDTEDDARN